MLAQIETNQERKREVEEKQRKLDEERIELDQQQARLQREVGILNKLKVKHELLHSKVNQEAIRMRRK